MLVTLKNTIHNTEAQVRVPESALTDATDGFWYLRLSDRVWNRVSKKLCGIRCCKCGVVVGPQEHKGRRLFIHG